MRTNFEQYSTIKKEVDIKEEPMTVNGIVLPLNENRRDILMDYGMNRKKVVHLDGSNSLFTECKKHVCSDPALSDLLTDSYPVFQEFTAKFNTWVDIECENNLRDGTVVKVMFFPKVIETDVLNPGSIKRKKDNDDNEANPKQHRILEDNFRKKSNSLIRCDENRGGDVENGRNKVIYVDSEKRSDIRPSFNTEGCNGKPVHHATTPTPVAKRDQSSLLPKTIKADVHVTSTNVQPVNLEEIEKCYLHPDFHNLPSYTVEQPTGVVLSERQILNERIPPIQSLNEEHSKNEKQNKKKVTPSRVQSCRVENQKGNSSQSRAVNVTPSRVQSSRVENQKGNSSQSRAVNATPEGIRSSLVEAIFPPTCPAKSVPKRGVSERCISWIPVSGGTPASKRLSWGQNGGNQGKKWWRTVFSDAGAFVWEGNRITYLERFCQMKEELVLFWGFRTFDGPNIIAPLASLRASEMADVLKHVVTSVIDYYKSSDINIQYLDSFRSQFAWSVMKYSVNENFYCMWPSCAKDLSPVYHAWKLVAEKVKNIPCFSKQEMISIVTRVWEKDVDIQLMCAEVISSLPQIIKSLILQKGCTPKVKVLYSVTNTEELPKE